MKTKILFFLIILLIIFSITASSKGIIIANNNNIIDIFRSRSKEKINVLIKDLISYDKVILHLGSKYVFQKGSAFYYKTSQENLKYFCDSLSKNNIEVYLWFMDSFGSKGFEDIYNDHKNIIDNNYKHIDQLDLKYEGIVIDLEWINLLTDIDNSNRYLQIIKYLTNKFKNKKLYAFAPIIDNTRENIKRGYPESELLQYLDNIIPMLYIKDGGFYLENNQLNFFLNKNRIEDIKNYYYENNYIPAVSIENGIILEKNNNLYFIKTTNTFNYKDKVNIVYEKNKFYYEIKGYKTTENFSIERNDGVYEEIKKNNIIHFFQLNTQNLIQENNYIWEYFISKGYKPE